MGGERRPRVGFARVVVTGAAELGGCGVHDELQARTLCVEAQGGPALLISLDHMGLTPGRRAALKSRLARECGIPAERTAICYSHTHAGADFRAGALAELLARSVTEARAKAAPCEIAYLRRDVGRRYNVNRRALVGHGLGAISIIFNRNVEVDLKRQTEEVGAQVRDFLRTGRNIWSPLYLQPEFDPPQPRLLSVKQKTLLSKLPAKLYLEGPVDPHLEWLGFRTARGRWLGSIVRFSAHPVMWRKSITKQVSADYTGVLGREIETATGAPALFANGPCGDVKPRYRHNTEDELERLGRGLASELLAHEAALAWEPLARAGFVRHDERFAVHPEVAKYAGRWPVAEAQRRQAELARRGNDTVATKRALDWALRCWGNGEIGWRRPTISLPFHLLSFNEVCLLGLPNEVWCEIGMEIKRRCRGAKLILAANCDVVTNYVPVAGAMGLGGYEAANSMLREAAANDYLRIAAEMMAEASR